jgi:predicted small lipoprotein YifL
MAESSVFMAYSVSALTGPNLPMKKTRILLLICAFALLVAACGQRGPLYLPEPAPEKPTADEKEENNEETSGA